MGDMYRNAAGVITYLGPPADEEVESTVTELSGRLYQHFMPNFDMLFGTDQSFGAYAQKRSFPITTLLRSLQKEVEACEIDCWSLNDAASKKWLLLTALVFGHWTQRLWPVTTRCTYDALLLTKREGWCRSSC